jgi:hypothetical protein
MSDAEVCGGRQTNDRLALQGPRDRGFGPLQWSSANDQYCCSFQVSMPSRRSASKMETR